MSAHRPDEGVAILEAKDLTVRYGGLVALSEVSLAVPAETVVGLVGPNGAGKTTLFGVLSGIQRANRGAVRLAGSDITASSPQDRARAGLARTFQQPQLFAGLTVREHFALAYRSRRARHRVWRDLIDGSAWRQRDSKEDAVIRDIVQKLDLGRVADRDVAGMPLGLSRLVEIGRALAGGPSVILLDEASSGLDQFERDRLMGVLASVPQDYGSALLIVEHDVDLVLGISSQVYVLDFGIIIAAGDPTAIRKSEIVRAAYLGEEDIEEEVAQ